MSANKKPGGRAPGEADRLVARLQHQREDERSRLSRMLHHEISGMLAAARMDLSRLLACKTQEAGQAEALRRVDELLEQVIGRVRDEMQRLHPALIDHFGITVALRQLVEEKFRGSGRRYAVDFAVDAPDLEPPLPIAVFRLLETLLDDDRLLEFGASLRTQRDGYLLELALAHGPADPVTGRADDLRALRSWLEALGATWKEASQDGQWSVELRLPRRAMTAPDPGDEAARTVAAVPVDRP